MSAQPLTPSNNNNIKHVKWQELINFAEQLLLQSDIESLLACIISTFERLFSCNLKLWLAGPYSNLLQNGVSQDVNLHLSVLTDLMKQAYGVKHVFPKPESGSYVGDQPSSIALPLMIRDEILGVIQLDRLNQAAFNAQDIESVYGFGLQSSIAVDWIK